MITGPSPKLICQLTATQIQSIDVNGRKIFMCEKKQDHGNPQYFTKLEDKMLESFIMEFGLSKLNEISEQMEIPEELCKERWINHIKPQLMLNEWSFFEDVLLMDLFKEYGSKWNTISKFIPNKSPRAVRYRYNKLMKDKFSDLTEITSFERVLWE